MRILIAEQNALLRAGIAGLVRSGRPDWGVAQSDTLAETRQVLRAGGIMVCLIANELLPPGAHELMNLRIDFPLVKLIVRSDNSSRHTILDYFRDGAQGCITASTSAADLLGAITCVAAGAVAVPAVMVDLIDSPAPQLSSGPPIRQPVHLTGRQTEVLGLLGEGRSTKEIARSLDLAVGTIKVHLASIYRTLGARNRVEAAIKAVANRNNDLLTQKYA